MLNPDQVGYLRSASPTHQITMSDSEDIFSYRDALGLKTGLDSFLEWICCLISSTTLYNHLCDRAMSELTVAVGGTEGFTLRQDETGVVMIDIAKTPEERQREGQEDWLQGMNRERDILGTRVSNPFLRILIQRIFDECRVSEFAPSENSVETIQVANQRISNRYHQEYPKWLDEHRTLRASINEAAGSRRDYANLDLFLWQYDHFVQGLT